MLKLLQQLKKIELYKYLVAAIILAVPLYPKFPFLTVPGTYVSIRLEDFLLGLVFILWIFKNAKNWREFLRNKVVLAIIVFLIVTLVSVISGIFLTQTVVLHIGVLHWLRRFEYLSALFIGMSAVKNPRDLSFFVKCLMLVIAISLVFGVGQKYFQWPIITTQNYEYSKGVALRYMEGAHINGTFAGHYDLASFLILGMPIILNLFFLKASKLKHKLILLVILGAGYWLLLNAASRISMLSFVTSLGIGLFFIRKYKFIPIVVIFSLFFIIFSGNLLHRYSQIINVTIQKIIYIMPKFEVNAATETPAPQPVIEDRSTSIRTNVEWPRALRAFQKNPLMGTGFSSITLATDNDYLRLLGETGLIGFAAFMLIFIRLFQRFKTTLPFEKTVTLSNAFMGGLFGGVVGIFLNAVFIDIFEASKLAIIFWLLIGFALAVINYEKNTQTN